MKINEFVANMSHVDFNMEKALEVKRYLPIEEKKLIAQGILYECIENVDGVMKIDSVQKYLSYVKYMILKHTNLEYTQEDYDALCSTVYGESNLLGAIFDTFRHDADSCYEILQMMVDDRIRDGSIEASVTKFLAKVGEIVESMSEKLNDKVDDFDFSKMIPSDADKNTLYKFLNTYVK